MEWHSWIRNSSIYPGYHYYLPFTLWHQLPFLWLLCRFWNTGHCEYVGGSYCLWFARPFALLGLALKSHLTVSAKVSFCGSSLLWSLSSFCVPSLMTGLDISSLSQVRNLSSGFVLYKICFCIPDISAFQIPETSKIPISSKVFGKSRLNYQAVFQFSVHEDESKSKETEAEVYWEKKSVVGWLSKFLIWLFQFDISIIKNSILLHTQQILSLLFT